LIVIILSSYLLTLIALKYKTNISLKYLPLPKNFVTNGYKIVTVQPFDLFPQTRHIENVVTLNRC